MSSFAEGANSAAAAMGALGIYPSVNSIAAQPTMAAPVVAALLLCAIVLVAFWIWMIVHAIRNDIKEQATWILILMLTNFWGAIVYYFAVKRKLDKATL
jgi:multisubunit Na+/H+ antiporter MnhC subunit